MLLTWRPGQFGRWHVTEPGEVDAQRLVRVAGRVLGPGCVMSDCYDPGRDRPDDWDGQAGLILVDADADAPGDPAAWLVIERLASCQCGACASRIPDLPERHVPTSANASLP
jgi:hypothetical protein